MNQVQKPSGLYAVCITNTVENAPALYRTHFRGYGRDELIFAFQSMY